MATTRNDQNKITTPEMELPQVWMNGWKKFKEITFEENNKNKTSTLKPSLSELT